MKINSRQAIGITLVLLWPMWAYVLLEMASARASVGQSQGIKPLPALGYCGLSLMILCPLPLIAVAFLCGRRPPRNPLRLVVPPLLAIAATVTMDWIGFCLLMKGFPLPD